MTAAELELSIQSKQDFKSSIRAALASEVFQQEVYGKFVKGRVSYVNCLKLPGGSELRFSFYDTVKKPLNSRGVAIPDKESFVSYLSVSVYPASLDRPYYVNLKQSQFPWKNSKSKALVLHNEQKAELVKLASALGIDLNHSEHWCCVYSEGWDE